MRPLKNLGMNHFLQALSICVFWQAEIMNAGKSKWSIGNVTGTSRKSITNATDSPTCRVWGRGMLGFNDKESLSSN